MISVGYFLAAALLGVASVDAAITAPPIIAAALPEGLPDKLHCGGAEPFWSLAIEDQEAIFETPEAQGRSGIRFAVEDGLAASNRSGLWVLRMRSQAGRESVALLRQTACTDGMSELGSRFVIALLDAAGDDSLLDGCCQ